MLLPLLMNLDMLGAEVGDKGRDAGSGRQQLRFVDPREIYGRPRLKPEPERKRIRPKPEAEPPEISIDLAVLRREAASLAFQLAALQGMAAEAVAGERRALESRAWLLEANLRELDRIARLLREDEEFLLLARLAVN